MHWKKTTQKEENPNVRRRIRIVHPRWGLHMVGGLHWKEYDIGWDTRRGTKYEKESWKKEVYLMETVYEHAERMERKELGNGCEDISCSCSCSCPYSLFSLLLLLLFLAPSCSGFCFSLFALARSCSKLLLLLGPPTKSTKVIIVIRPTRFAKVALPAGTTATPPFQKLLLLLGLAAPQLWQNLLIPPPRQELPAFAHDFVNVFWSNGWSTRWAGPVCLINH